MVQDLRYALRLFSKNPGFTAVAVGTLALAIGANTALFSVTDALLLRPLPYPHPERLALVSAFQQSTGLVQGQISWPRFKAIEQGSRSFAGVAAFTNDVFNLSGLGEPEQLSAARVSWNFFRVLGVHPALGRSFVAAEDQPQGRRVALISHRLWERRFGADRSVLGRHVALDQTDYTVIGVLPPDFEFAFFPSAVDLYTTRPNELNLVTPAQVANGVMFLLAVGRLRDGVNVRTAQAELDKVAADYAREHPGRPDTAGALRGGDLSSEAVYGARAAVLILFGAVGLVLLIGCANVAGLLLSRALARRREFALRAAIGAGRGAIVRQLLTESVLLAIAGGGIGLLLSIRGTTALAALAASNLPRASEITPDLRVLAYTFLISVLAGVLFGLAPAFDASRTDLNEALRAEGRGGTPGRRRNHARAMLVVFQVALSLLLLIGAGLLIRNFVQLRRPQPGFEAGHLLTMNIALPPARYTTPLRMAAFYDELVRQASAVSGIRAAAVASALPANPSRFSPMLPEGQPVVPFAQRPIFNVQMVGPGYAGTLGTPLVQGREFTARDIAGAPLVCMVNQLVVRRYWPNQNPLGKHIYIGNLTPIEVVGVLADVRNAGLAADVQPEVDFPFAQRAWPSMFLITRTAGDPKAFVGALRARVRAIDPDQPVTAVRTMDEVLEVSAAQPRFTAALLGSLAALALLITIVGIYASIAYSVSERSQEMAIRVALGAARADILRLVIGRGLGITAGGIVIGLAAALLLTRLVASLLYRVSVLDPFTFIAGIVLFLSVALVASYVPARRATRADPMQTLR